jgi:hypothetical protein
VAGDGTVVVTADYAQFLTGDEANEAALESGVVPDGLPEGFQWYGGGILPYC